MADQPQPISSSPVERALVALVAHRMSLWLFISLALLAAIFFLARHMVSVVIFKILLMTLAAWIGYGLSLAVEGCLKHGPDRALRPHEIRAKAAELRRKGRIAADGQAADLERSADAMLARRAIIVAACLIAAALGA